MNTKKTVKKYDATTVANLIAELNKQMRLAPAKRSHIPLNLKENNVIKAINPVYSHSLTGGWNGYGYEQLGKHLLIGNFSKVKHAIKKLQTVEVVAKHRMADTMTETAKWATRIVKLTGITIEQAELIVEEKIQYKNDCIEAMEDRQKENYSSKRQTIINKMERANPLRRIKDADHAQAILAASDRHTNTDYDVKLEEARELVTIGELDHSEVKAYARENMA